MEALIAALKPHNPQLRGAPEGLPFFFDTRTFANVLNLTLATDIGDVDLLGEVPGAVFLEDLIAMKRVAGRPKDQAHLMELERLRELTAHDDAQTL